MTPYFKCSNLDIWLILHLGPPPKKRSFFSAQTLSHRVWSGRVRAHGLGPLRSLVYTVVQQPPYGAPKVRK